MATRSPHRLRGPIIKLRRGLALYQTYASPFYFARILDPRIQRYKVRSTKETSRIEARRVAEELALKICARDAPAPQEFSFKTYARRFVEKGRQLAASGERNANYIRTSRLFLDHDDWGLIRHFGHRDVRELTTRDWQLYIESLARKRSDLSASTRNMLMATFRNVLKGARDDGLIDMVPDTPRLRQKDNPRSFFRFAPLVPAERDEFEALLTGAKQLAADHVLVRGVEATEELYDLIMFVVSSFARPTTTELYALKHNDITIETAPKRLLVTIRDGKTGFRVANTMPAAVAAYERLRLRYPDASGEDYIFLPGYPNRATAARIIQRQFNLVMERTGLKHDPVTNTHRTIYCLRHTAICMTIIRTHGQVNIYNLAKNAGTSVDQIERFYAKHLPLSREMAMNLQSFGQAENKS
jgi:integrase